MKLFLALIIPALALGLPSRNTFNRWYEGDCGRSKYPDAGEPESSVIQVVGGEDAREYEFPHQVQLRLFGDHWCGGSIINEQWVLTAAHCILFRDSMTVVLREHNIHETSGLEQEFELEQIIVHEDYPRTAGTDIALMKLASPATFNDDIRPVCSPEPDNLYVGAESSASGWGALEWEGSGPSILQWVPLPVPSNEDCIAANEEVGYNPPVETEICAGEIPNHERDTCQGDSGGPLVVKENGQFRLIGLTSRGFECAGGAPGIYCRVTSYLDWIDETMANN